MFLLSVYLMPLIQAQQNVYNIAYSQAVTHPSTNATQCCLTSVIGRELVLSTWYGRRHRIHSLLGTQRKMFLLSVYLMPLIQAQQNVYNIAYSQAVTHPSTNLAQCCLTSVIRRELVRSAWYGRRQLPWPWNLTQSCITSFGGICWVQVSLSSEN